MRRVLGLSLVAVDGVSVSGGEGRDETGNKLYRVASGHYQGAGPVVRPHFSRFPTSVGVTMQSISVRSHHPMLHPAALRVCRQVAPSDSARTVGSISDVAPGLEVPWTASSSTIRLRPARRWNKWRGEA